MSDALHCFYDLLDCFLVRRSGSAIRCFWLMADTVPRIKLYVKTRNKRGLDADFILIFGDMKNKWG